MSVRKLEERLKSLSSEGMLDTEVTFEIVNRNTTPSHKIEMQTISTEHGKSHLTRTPVAEKQSPSVGIYEEEKGDDKQGI